MRILIAFSIVLLLSFCRDNSNKASISVDPNTTTYEILRLAHEKNIKELNDHFVNPDFGIYEIFRRGAVNQISQWEKIEIAESATGTLYQVITNINENDLSRKIVNYNVRYDCDSYEWDKDGLFITKSTFPEVSKIIASMKENKSRMFSDNEIKKLNLIANDSYKVVLTDADIIFYLTQIDKHFYITLIDRISTDCGA